jgi:hypothetical protein
MAKYKFKAANSENGFFSKLRSDKVSEKVSLIRSYDDGSGSTKNKITTLSGNMIPGIVRLKKPIWNVDMNQWEIAATEAQLTEWAKALGATDKNGNFIDRVSKNNQRDPFITSIQIVISPDYVLDDNTALGKVHKAVLLARRDVNFGDTEGQEISHYDLKHKVEYDAIRLGDRAEPENVKDVSDIMYFANRLLASTLEKKVKILESIGVSVPEYPEEKIIDGTLYKKWYDEGDKKPSNNNMSRETNREKINRLLDAEFDEVEVEYIISKGLKTKLISWIPAYKYYEFDGINVGRNLTMVEGYFRSTQNDDMLQKLASEIKLREVRIEKAVSKGGKKGVIQGTSDKA